MKTPARCTAALALVALAPALCSCNVVGPIFYGVHGPGKVPAQFTLDPAAPTVVLVDDPASKVGRRRLRAEMATAATETLLAKRVSTTMLEPQPALALTSQRVDGRPMSITEIGRAAGADVVVYALLTEFTLSADGAANLPVASARVKVLDAASGERLWPEDPKGYLVQLRPEYRSGNVAIDPSAAVEAEHELAVRMGVAIAQVFYEHEVTESARR